MTTTAVRDSQLTARPATADSISRRSVPTGGRRKQHCPRRIFDRRPEETPQTPRQCHDNEDDDEDVKLYTERTGAPAESASLMDSQRYDNFICGQCCAEFYSLSSFLAHKKACNNEWPVLIPFDAGGAPPSGSSESPVDWQVTAGEANAREEHAVTVKSEDFAHNGRLEQRVVVSPVLRSAMSNGYSQPPLVDAGALASLIQIQSALVTLQQQQMQQTQLIHHMYRHLIGDRPMFVEEHSKGGYSSPSQRLSSSSKRRPSVSNGFSMYTCSSQAAASGHDGLMPSYAQLQLDSLAKQQRSAVDQLIYCQQQIEGQRELNAKRSRDQRSYAWSHLQHGSSRVLSKRRTVEQLFKRHQVTDKRPSSCPHLIVQHEGDDATLHRPFRSLPGSPFDILMASGHTLSESSSEDIGQFSSDSRTLHTVSYPSGAPIDLTMDAAHLTGQLMCPMMASQQRLHGSLYSTGAPYDCAQSEAASAFASAADHNLLTSVIGNEVDDDWESMMEVTASDEAEKIRKLVGEGCGAVTDPNQCVICKRVLSCKSALQMHYRTHTGERPFKCKICQRAFTTKGNLKTHMGVHRTKPAFRIFHQCPECLKKFTNAVVLQQHLRSHGTRTAQLLSDNLLASAEFQGTSGAGGALFPKSSGSDLMAGILGSRVVAHSQSAVSSTPSSGSAHRFDQTNEQQPVASTVNVVERKDSNVEQSQVHFASGERSTIAEAATSAYANLCFVSIDQGGQAPQRLNSNSIVLPPAGATLVGGAQEGGPRAEASSPIVTFPARPSTTCNICFKSFACQSALEIHYRSHTKERPFKCHICSRGFSTKGNMKQHLLTHKVRQLPGNESRQMQLGCDADKSSCDDGCSPGMEGDEVRLVGGDHLQAINGDQKDPSPLESIQRMWSQAENLAAASNNNGNVTCQPNRKGALYSKHQCQLCCKHFSSASALQIHMRTHTGDKPFKCNICERAFTTKGNLKVHMGTHMWSNSGQRGRRIFDSSLSPLPYLMNSCNSMEELLGTPRDSQSIGVIFDSSGGVDELRKEVQATRGSASLPGESSSYDRAPRGGSLDVAKSPRQSSCSSPGLRSCAQGYGSLGSSLVTNFGSTVFSSGAGGLQLASPSSALNFFSTMTAGGDLTTSGMFVNERNASAPITCANSSARAAEPQAAIIPIANGANVEAILRAWQNVCHICQKTCSSSADLEDHLKTHLLQNNLKASGTVQVD